MVVGCPLRHHPSDHARSTYYSSSTYRLLQVLLLLYGTINSEFYKSLSMKQAGEPASRLIFGTLKGRARFVFLAHKVAWRRWFCVFFSYSSQFVALFVSSSDACVLLLRSSCRRRRTTSSTTILCSICTGAAALNDTINSYTSEF